MAGYQASAEELATLAKDIVNVDNDTQATLRGVRSTVEGLQGMWKGAAATAFTALMARFDEDARKLQEALRAIADQVDGSAAAYARQEEEATQLSTSISQRL
ncbi:WXG100 family type VII secretion target [Lentzea jiangxiensis]|uniref:ESAT-6-like protein n=1 Tax=Lentzea jiangxiensis TaxID=641025 RepID=A0A1H0E9K2_9PSEU|nr:WXG100 family type VII secretion target [Lentzea jiangxiensis]SDN78978.1 WXG100 family type VII secretion target [Lentzea jiangxiensis]